MVVSGTQCAKKVDESVGETHLVSEFETRTLWSTTSSINIYLLPSFLFVLCRVGTSILERRHSAGPKSGTYLFLLGIAAKSHVMQ